MANTYNWQISALDAKITEGDNSNVIYTVHWRLKATDETGEYQTDFYGSMGVKYDPDNFIEYDDLTKEDVVGWLEAGLDVEEMKLRLDNELDKKINPTDEVLRPDWD